MPARDGNRAAGEISGGASPLARRRRRLNPGGRGNPESAFFGQSALITEIPADPDIRIVRDFLQGEEQAALAADEEEALNELHRFAEHAVFLLQAQESSSRGRELAFRFIFCRPATGF
jgi:hypothetical protein